MSWSGFKKNVGRATTQVMMKTGHVEKTSDRDYEVEERRYRTLEAASLRLQKEAKGYLDSLRAMTASQMRIAETIDAFYGDSGAKDGVSRSYKQAVEDLDAETVKALDGPYRCVPSSLYDYADDAATIRDIEREWNFAAGNRRVYTRTPPGNQDLVQGRGLMDYLYRTTVLDPINRFCAYFPDINECIKKRQHKMLDYDAMRSKVKKLTEKPDKDPSKLPRAEKETEMVSIRSSFHRSKTTAPPSGQGRNSMIEVDLSIPSPPKAIQRPEIQRLRRRERTPERTMLSNPNPVIQRSASWLGPPAAAGSEPLPEAYINITPTKPGRTPRASSFRACSQGSLVKNTRTPRLLFRKAPAGRTVSGPVQQVKASSFIAAHESSKAEQLRTSMETTSSSETITTRNRTAKPTLTTPFFQPSELEEIMEPLMLDFLKKQADSLEQAKAAYEQLNEQLTNELPQLIDLRVPYLDPTFEALVKIQLRFCAEAYSRMAQVQQYLDASTRDQYASGDLDARVEDVLGQIRELSIAGTV